MVAMRHTDLPVPARPVAARRRASSAPVLATRSLGAGAGGPVGDCTPRRSPPDAAEYERWLLPPEPRDGVENDGALRSRSAPV